MQFSFPFFSLLFLGKPTPNLQKYKPGIEQLGSFEKAKIVPVVQVTSLLPSKTASECEHVTSTTVPGFTGNCVVVFIVPAQSVFSPVQPGAVEIFMVKMKAIKFESGCLKFIKVVHQLYDQYLS